MRESALTTYGPIVKVEHVDLVSLVDVSGAGDMVIVPFKRKFFWVRTAEASVNLLHNGKQVANISGTYADYGSTRLSCLDSSIKLAEEYCRNNGITPDSEVQVVVSLEITDSPAVLDLSPVAMNTMHYNANEIAYRPFDGSGERLVDGPLYRFAYANDGKTQGAIENWNAVCKGRVEGDVIEYYCAIPWVKSIAVLKNPQVWDSRIHLNNRAATADLQATLEPYRTVHCFLRELRDQYNAAQHNKKF